MLLKSIRKKRIAKGSSNLPKFKINYLELQGLLVAMFIFIMKIIVRIFI